MGYDVHITRKSEWFEDGPQISLSEWLSVVDGDVEMRLDGYAEASLPDGGVLRLEREGLAVWTGYSRHAGGNNLVWFLYSEGNITVKNPDKEIIGKMCSLAETLAAKVQGDEGEFYGPPSDTKQLGASLRSSETKRWWKRW